MTNDSGIVVPVLISRFPFRQHLGYRDIRKDGEEYYERRTKKLLTAKNDLVHGYYVNCGADYVAYCFPDIGVREAQTISRFYTFWVLFDDWIDNMTNQEEVDTLLSDFIRVTKADSVDSRDGYETFSDLLAMAGKRSDKTLELVRYSFLAWCESSRRIREIEINQEQVTYDEYMIVRQANCSMLCIHMSAACADPELAADIEELWESEGFKSAVLYSGKSMALLLDLYNALNPKHTEVTEHANVVRLVKKSLSGDMGWQDAVDRCVSLFYTYEEAMERALDRVSVTHPALARTMREIQGGNVLWMRDMRGLRYIDA
ncbi:terpene synthase family protein [Streptomyces sp. NPDC057617]|uniref:terpene synthase family protein n=1 Tax=Streptomyces sp. NPDC057617 TaxID=3346184 RepID=UPI0036B65ADA